MGCAGQINPQRGWKRSYGARRTSRLYLRSSARRRPLLLPRHPPQFNPPQFHPPLLRLCSPQQQEQEKQRLRQQQLAERQRQQQLAEQQRQEQKKAEQRKALQAQQQAQQQ